MDEGFIYERLKALSGGIDRAQYRDISKAFEEVIQYNRSSLEELKQQLERELRDVSDRFYLYGAVIQKADVSIVNDFLFPICPEPDNGSLATIFCQCAQDEMEEIFSKDQVLFVDTAKGMIEINAQIKPCERYQKEIEYLRTVFYENGIYWRTPYLPYVNKFGDVYCADLPEDTEIRSVRFKNWDFPVAHDLIPLWNVESIKLKCTVFPIPAIDERNYKHTLRLPYPQDGYVVRMEQDIKNVFMSTEGLAVVTEESIQKEFDLYRIAVRRNVSVPHHEITSNYRPMRHIDRQADHAAVRLCTMAEISRIVSSYEAGKGRIALVGIEPGRGAMQSLESKYEFTLPAREALCLKFRMDERDFLSTDLAVFLLSEVQSCFPQFLITGQWLEEGKAE